jgi:GntR family transcriptional regulator
MFVAAGARSKLRDSERMTFIRDEWPAIRERMKRLGIDAHELMKGELA